jgi:hypothetical protein
MLHDRFPDRHGRAPDFSSELHVLFCAIVFATRFLSSLPLLRSPQAAPLQFRNDQLLLAAVPTLQQDLSRLRLID